MSKAIATPHGKPTKYVELTKKETDERNAEIKASEAQTLLDAPYVRLAELDALLTKKAPRMLEDLYNNKPLDSSVVELLVEKESIRLKLKK